MTHFGILCPAAIGHLNPMCALGKELQRRGHRVTLFQVPDIASKVTTVGLEFQGIGEAEFPPGRIPQIYKVIGENSGIKALKIVIGFLKEETAMHLRRVPQALQAAGIEALLVDQVSPAGGTIADYLGIPFITVCNALLVNREDKVPPYFTHRSDRTTWWGILNNKAGNFLLDRLSQPIRKVVKEQRRQWNLPPYARWEDSGSPLA